MRIGMGAIHRGGMGRIGADNTLAAGGLTQADCGANGMVIDSVTGFCVLDQYATPAELQASQLSAGVNASANAPPVYLSSFQVQPNNGNLPPSYFVDQTAASVAQEVNAANGNL